MSSIEEVLHINAKAIEETLQAAESLYREIWDDELSVELWKKAICRDFENNKSGLSVTAKATETICENTSASINGALKHFGFQKDWVSWSSEKWNTERQLYVAGEPYQKGMLTDMIAEELTQQLASELAKLARIYHLDEEYAVRSFTDNADMAFGSVLEAIQVILDRFKDTLSECFNKPMALKVNFNYTSISETHSILVTDNTTFQEEICTESQNALLDIFTAEHLTDFLKNADVLPPIVSDKGVSVVYYNDGSGGAYYEGKQIGLFDLTTREYLFTSKKPSSWETWYDCPTQVTEGAKQFLKMAEEYITKEKTHTEEKRNERDL